MSRMGREIGRAFRNLQGLVGNPVFKWGDQDIACVADVLEASSHLGSGGFGLEADLHLYVNVSDLPDPAPVLKDRITYRGREYVIDSIGELPGDDQIRYACSDPLKAS